MNILKELKFWSIMLGQDEIEIGLTEHEKKFLTLVEGMIPEIEKLEALNKEMLDALINSNYLLVNKLNAIGHKSKLHQEWMSIIEKAKKELL